MIETSKAEKVLANKIAERIADVTNNIDEAVDILYNISRVLTSSYDLFIYDSVVKLINDIPDFFKVDTNVAFPNDDEDLTNNIFSAIAFALSERYNIIENKGVVFTPACISVDMAKIALLEYLTSCSFDRDSLTQYLNKGGENEYAKIIRSLKWHDPCVGSGVFPLAVMMLYNTLNICCIPDITAFDINPLMVCSTIIRLSLTSNTYMEFEQGIEIWKERILLQNTLILNDNKEYDIVIGNPPYVQADRIDKDLKIYLRQKYNFIYHNKADMYIYFLAYGIGKLRKGGVLCFISPAQFQKSNYGANVRSFIAENCLVRNIFDFNELPVFDGISIHGSIYCIEKGNVERPVYTHIFDSVPESSPLLEGLKLAKLIQPERVSKEQWNINSENADDIIKIFESGSIKLIQYVDRIYSGIKTNCSDIYVIGQETLNLFDRAEQDRYFKPMYLAKKIRTWNSSSSEYMLIIKQGETLEQNTQVYSYLLKHKERISGSGEQWYCLRACSYYDKLAIPKIIYPDIATSCRFAMDLKGYMIPDGAYFIPQEDYFLLGVLNSCIGRYYFRERCASIGNPGNGGRLRFKKIYVEHFPVKIIGNDLYKKDLSVEIAGIARTATIEGAICDEAAKRLDELAAMIYEIPTKYLNEVLRA